MKMGKTSSNYPYKVSHFSASFWGVAIAESLGMFVGLGNGHMKKGLFFFIRRGFFMNIDFKIF